MSEEILYKYFRNEATPQEIRQIEDWLAADPSHQKEFDEAHVMFNVTVAQEPEYVRRKNMQQPERRRALVRVWRIALSAAAAVLLAVLAGYIGSLLERDGIYEELTARYNVISVPAGDMMSLMLQDGTEIHLNGGASLEYPVVFDRGCRRVRLSGEAYLDVAHDPSCPFVVETFASEIEVLGTEFNVLADEKNDIFSTVLVSGKVKVSTVDAGTGEYEQVILSPDEKVRIVDNHLVVSKVLASDEVSWTDGYINLRGVGFEELMHRFENMYGVDILIARSDMPEIGYLSGKIKVSEGIDFALHLLQEACDFSYEKDARTGAIIIK